MLAYSTHEELIEERDCLQLQLMRRTAKLLIAYSASFFSTLVIGDAVLAASAMFRLISAQVNGTPPNMKVDPYRVSLKKPAEPVELENEYNIDPVITKDVDLMWFYAKKETA